MKENVKKPRVPAAGPVKKTPKAKSPAKRKRRKKLAAEDRIRAVLVAAVLILSAGAASLTLVYYDSLKNRSEAAARAGDPAETGTAETPPLPDEKAADLSRGDVPPAVSGTGASRTDEPRPVAPTTGRTVSRPAAPPVPAKPRAPAESGPVSTPAARPQAPAAKPAPRAETPRVPASKPAPAAESPPTREKAPAPETRSFPVASLPPAGSAEHPVAKGVLVFVIDDAGHNLRELEPFLRFPGPLTIAVLPGLPHSAEAARRIRAAGKEVFLHQPMEPLGGQNPGPGAIRAGMGRDEIRSILSRNLEELGPVAGINNHEGSRITSDEEAMETILSFCRERGVLFLDSRTTADTAAPGTARRLGMNIGERDVFVDNEQKRESMETYIKTGLQKAEQKGRAIMIGHVWSPALAPLLSELLPDLRARGYSFSSASKAISGVR